MMVEAALGEIEHVQDVLHARALVSILIEELLRRLHVILGGGHGAELGKGVRQKRLRAGAEGAELAQGRGRGVRVQLMLGELLKDLLDRAMTEEEVQAIEDKYIKHFDEDKILKIIHDSKVEKGFIKD